MVNRGWLYGLIVFLAQTCNPYYSANDTRNQYEEEIVFEDQSIEENEVIEIPMDAFEIDEAIEVEPPRTQIREMEPPPPPPVPRRPAPEEEIFKVVEDMPRFPGCEQKVIGKSELKECSQKEMIQFVRENIKYPATAKENGIEGTVVLQFVVDRSGEIKNVQILRDIGAGCGKEALRVVNTMPKWIPGKQRGRPVNVQYTLPVGFKLPKETALDEEPMSLPVKPESEKVFKVVDQMPRFPGCEGKGLPYSEWKECSEKKMLKFVYGNIKYPKIAQENGIEGRVILSYIVNKDGTISDVEVIRDPGGGCGEEAMRVIKTMPKWIPGKSKGEVVKVKYIFPVVFKLNKKDKKRKRKRGN
ncbi:MAG: energy transducer TonB [Saprospiraceae bacterium]